MLKYIIELLWVFSLLLINHSVILDLFAAACLARLLLVLAGALAALLVLTAFRWTTAATYQVKKGEMITFCRILDKGYLIIQHASYSTHFSC